MRRFEQLDPRWMLAANSSLDEAPSAEAVSELTALLSDTVHAADAGSTMSTAYDLGTLGTLRSLAGSVGGRDPSDVMKFTLNNESTVSLGLSALHADIDLYLYNSQGQRLATSDNSGTASESISTTLAAGTYYILVAPWLYAISSYTITVGAEAIAPTSPSNPVTDPGTTDPPATTPTTPTNPTTPVTAFPNVPYYGGSNEWNLNSINAPEAWAQGYTGQGVVVAVVDTGVDLNHPDLMSQIWVNEGEIPGNGIDDDGDGYVDDVHGWDFASNDNNPDDGNGHGTHVAGTIAAEANGTGSTGVAPGATIMPVRVLGNDGSGSYSSVAAGIRYAVNEGANIINLSLGGSYSSVVYSAIQYALSHNVLVVAAAGNDGASTPGYPARFSSSLSNLISVGAYTSSGALASFSDHVGNSGAVQVDAPGVGVYSTYMGDTYARLGGTSMATPHVAGLAALALSANHSLTAVQLRSLIVAGADHSVSGSDSAGGIDAALTVALAAAGQTGSSSASSVSSVQAASQVVSVRRFVTSSLESADVPTASTVASFAQLDSPGQAGTVPSLPGNSALSVSSPLAESLVDQVAWSLANSDNAVASSLAADAIDGLDLDEWFDETLFGHDESGAEELLTLLV